METKNIAKESEHAMTLLHGAMLVESRARIIKYHVDCQCINPNEKIMLLFKYLKNDDNIYMLIKCFEDVICEHCWIIDKSYKQINILTESNYNFLLSKKEHEYQEISSFE